MSGGGTGLISGGGLSIASGGRGKSGFDGCSIMPDVRATTLPPDFPSRGPTQPRLQLRQVMPQVTHVVVSEKREGDGRVRPNRAGYAAATVRNRGDDVHQMPIVGLP